MRCWVTGIFLLLAAHVFPSVTQSSSGYDTGTNNTPALVAGERLFGYDRIETVEDLKEVSPFSNIVFLDPMSPTFERLATLARAREMRIAIAWDQVLFDTSAIPFRLRGDYQQRFEIVVAEAPRLFRDLVFQQVVDEPYWNGVSDEELEVALDLMKQTFPGVPTLIVLAWPTLDSRSEPVPSDWVAFDRYFVEDPFSDPIYQSYWDRMLLQNPGKPVVVVADGFYSDAHASAGVTPDEMGAVLRSYRDLFESESRAVAFGVFRWTDTSQTLGSRSLPDAVLREHIVIGSEITQRCGIPPGLDPLSGETVLWFLDCRFYARVTIDDPRTELEVAQGFPLSDESGYFWFFKDSNVEISIKMVDGATFNNHYWVFLSDTTDVNYRLEVREVLTGRSWTHENQAGEISARRDTLAFPR